MRIKRIVLAGFKSYGKRTVLRNFDSNLNCITGLNGSGKSNILDAICFVLGLQSYSLARVDKLQDFIYKSGQSGVTEAKVSIVFEDSNRQLGEQIWFNSEREVIVSRSIKRDRSRFTLNGKKVTLASIKKLFKSIGLNMDNPNSFFVKQGTISSIVNFRPRDLLALIEECAGVNYFNGIRRHFDHVITKQDRKMSNVEEIYSQELHPAVRRLKNEVRVLGEFQQSRAELKFMRNCRDRLREKVAQYRLETVQASMAEKKSRLCELKNEITRKRRRVKELSGKIANSERSGAGESKLGDLERQFEAKKGELKTIQKKIEVIEQTSIRLKTGEIDEIERRVDDLNKTVRNHQLNRRMASEKADSLREQLRQKKAFLVELNIVKDSGSPREGQKGEPLGNAR